VRHGAGSIARRDLELFYAASNPVKDGLIERVQHWPGRERLRSGFSPPPLRADAPALLLPPRSERCPPPVTLDLTIPPELGPPEEVRQASRPVASGSSRARQRSVVDPGAGRGTAAPARAVLARLANHRRPALHAATAVSRRAPRRLASLRWSGTENSWPTIEMRVVSCSPVRKHASHAAPIGSALCIGTVSETAN